MLVAGASALTLSYVLRRRRARDSPRKTSPNFGKDGERLSRRSKGEAEESGSVARRVELSVLRQCRIAEHCGKDHGGELAMVRKTSFSLEPTIFKNVGSPLARAVLTAKLSREPFWHESASQRIASCFASVPRAPPRGSRRN